MENKLKKENAVLFKNMAEYIGKTNLEDAEKYEIQDEILKIMLDAQTEKKPVDLYFGRGYKRFCNSVIEAYFSNKSLAYKILNFLGKYVFYLVFMVLIIGVYNAYKGGISNFSVTLDQFIASNLIDIFVFPISSMKNARMGYYSLYGRFKFKSRKLSINLVVFTVILVVLLKSLSSAYIPLKTLNSSVSITHNIYIVVIGIVIVLLIEFYKEYVVYLKKEK